MPPEVHTGNPPRPVLSQEKERTPAEPAREPYRRRQEVLLYPRRLNEGLPCRHRQEGLPYRSIKSMSGAERHEKRPRCLLPGSSSFSLSISQIMGIGSEFASMASCLILC
jgi:hypothetical protein